MKTRTPVNRTMRRKQNGQSLVETLLALPFVLLLIFGIVEFTLIYRAKLTLNHATEMAVRAGTLNHGCKNAMYEQFARSMTPLLMNGEATPQRYLDVLTTRRIFFETYTHIRILHPSPAVFDTFAEKVPLTPAQIMPCAQTTSGSQLKAFALHEVIPHDGLAFRPTNPVNVTGLGELTLQDANLLKIQVRYCHKLSVPLLDHLIVAVQHWTMAPAQRQFMDYCIRGGGAIGPPILDEKLILLSAHATARMQTPFIRKSLERN